MWRIAFILLQYVTVTSTRSVFGFYSASKHAEINDNQPTLARLAPTLAPAVDKDASLNIPHPVGADTVTSFGLNSQQNVMTGPLDRAENDVQSRKLPILRVEMDTVKSPDPSPPADFDPSTGKILPQREVLRGAEVLSEDRNGKGVSDTQVVFSNTLTQVKLIPTGVAPITVPSVPTSAATTTIPEKKKDLMQEVVNGRKESVLDEKSFIESGGVIELVEHEVDELPSPKTLLVHDRKPTIISSISLVELSNGSALAAMIDKETPQLDSPIHDKFEVKSIEDEDGETFNELDEKSEIDLEFHDDADLVPKATTEVPSTSSSTTPATTSSSSKKEEPMTDEEMFDLLMYLVTLLPQVERSQPSVVEKNQPSVWSKIIAGLQCALRDCRRAFPHLTTSATPIGNGTFIIRRARSECSCPVDTVKIRGDSYEIRGQQQGVSP
ncbi:hypothetical protein COOONC_12133 [Cooperia oncophora]